MRDTDLISDRYYSLNPIYKQIYESLGIHFACALVIVYRNLLLGVFNMFRKKSNGNYSKQELEILQNLLPHIEIHLYKYHPQKEDSQAIEIFLRKEYSLTPREIEIIKLIENSYSNKEIALELEITESTVKRHVSNILRKLNVRNRMEVINFVRN